VTGIWIVKDDKVWPGNETGGDVQVIDGYSVRFVLCDEESREPLPLEQEPGEPPLYAVLDLCFYAVTAMRDFYDEDGIAKDSDGQPLIWLNIQSEATLCTDPAEPGTTEVLSDIDYDDLNEFFGNREEADKAALKLAEKYFKDPKLANRDIGWDGSWPFVKR
jgi:hypothetical protein